MREEKAARGALAETLARIEATLAATLPHLATKADIAALRSETKADIAGVRLDIARLDADKPGKAYMWGILAVLLTAYACGLAALAIVK